VQLADRVGRDYTTVSRQVAKLESFGLVKRQGSCRRPPGARGGHHR
jgi:predicted transcriptional regulator